MLHGSSNTAETLGDCLLSLYACITDPIHFREMTQVLTSWLSDEQDEIAIVHFEHHAERVWDLLDAFVTSNTPENEEDKINDIVGVGRRKFVPLDDAKQILHPDDLHRLDNWLKTNPKDANDAKPLLVRAHRSESGTPELGVLGFKPDGTIGLFLYNSSFDEVVIRFFAESFSLTRAEMHVVQELVRGGKLREISDRLGKSVETLRAQVKAVTAKLGVSSQMDIVRLAGQATVLTQSAFETGVIQSAPTNGAKQLRTRDGRIIEYEVDGAQHAKTVLFVHCLTEGRRWTTVAKRMVTDRGYKLIRISRAGFANSDVNPKTGSALLDDHLSDTLSVLNQEGVNKVSIFAQSSGFAVAYAFGLRHPEIVHKIVGLNVSPPIVSRKDAECLKGIFKTGALANLYAPTAAKLVARFAVRRLMTRRPEDLEDPLVMPGINLTEVENEDGLEVYVKNTEDALKHHGDGYWREASYANVDWSYAQPLANTRPTTVLLESQDSPFTHPGKIAPFAAKIGAELKSVPTFLPMVSGPLPKVLSELEFSVL